MAAPRERTLSRDGGHRIGPGPPAPPRGGAVGGPLIEDGGAPTADVGCRDRDRLQAPTAEVVVDASEVDRGREERLERTRIEDAAGFGPGPGVAGRMAEQRPHHVERAATVHSHDVIDGERRPALDESARRRSRLVGARGKGAHMKRAHRGPAQHVQRDGATELAGNVLEDVVADANLVGAARAAPAQHPADARPLIPDRERAWRGPPTSADSARPPHERRGQPGWTGNAPPRRGDRRPAGTET